MFHLSYSENSFIPIVSMSTLYCFPDVMLLELYIFITIEELTIKTTLLMLRLRNINLILVLTDHFTDKTK